MCDRLSSVTGDTSLRLSDNDPWGPDRRCSRAISVWTVLAGSMNGLALVASTRV